MVEGQGVARKPPVLLPSSGAGARPSVPAPRAHPASSLPTQAQGSEFTGEETFVCLSGHRFEFIPRQGLAFRKQVIKEFVSSFLNQILLHLLAALLRVMLQPLCPCTNKLHGRIPTMTPRSCTAHHVHTHAQKLLLPAQLLPRNAWCRLNCKPASKTAISTACSPPEMHRSSSVKPHTLVESPNSCSLRLQCRSPPGMDVPVLPIGLVPCWGQISVPAWLPVHLK